MNNMKRETDFFLNHIQKLIPGGSQIQCTNQNNTSFRRDHRVISLALEKRLLKQIRKGTKH